MKKLFLGLIFSLTVFTSNSAFAGWGAIACNAYNICSVSYGWPTYYQAVNYAMYLCGDWTCQMVRWEHNACTSWGSAVTCN